MLINLRILESVIILVLIIITIITITIIIMMLMMISNLYTLHHASITVLCFAVQMIYSTMGFCVV